MYVIDLNQLYEYKIPKPNERSIRIVIDTQSPLKIEGVSITTTTLAPFGKTDLHQHGIVELMYVLAGAGETVIEGNTFDLHPGMMIAAPPGISHQIINTSPEPLQLLCIWSPGINGQEIVQRAMAKSKK